VFCVLVDVSGMELKIEADSNDIAECSPYDKSTPGMFAFSINQSIKN